MNTNELIITQNVTSIHVTPIKPTKKYWYLGFIDNFYRHFLKLSP
jgi:hypothetical protein